jgi:GWxTD domain-containing protein
VVAILEYAIMLALLVLSLVTPPVAPAPAAPCFAAALPVIDSATTHADSVALVERFLASPPGGSEACGEMLAGFLIGLTSTPADDQWQERQRGQNFVQEAMRDHSDEPRLYLAMALLYKNRQSRVDAQRMLSRAEDREDQGEVPLTTREKALIWYYRGLIYQDEWISWRSYGQLDQTSQGQWRCSNDEMPTTESFTSSGTGSDNTWLIAVNQLCPQRFEENMDTYFKPRSDMNRDRLDALVKAYETAEATDPTFFAPGRELLGEWVYEANWERALQVANRIKAHFPNDYRANLYLGLVHHEMGKDSLAAQAFAWAMAELPPDMADAMEDIRPLLRDDQKQAYDQIDSTGQFEVRVAFWNSVDPMYLTTWNERRLEHWSRVTAANLMFSEPSTGELGCKTFAGQMWIRYGRPLHMRELMNPGARVVFWDLGDGPDVSFTRNFGYRSDRPTDEAIQYSTKLAAVAPQRYSLPTLVDSVQSLDVQVARMLGANDKPEILAYGGWPEGVHRDARAGVTVLDLSYFPVAQWRGKPGDRPGLRVEMAGMAQGQYSLTFEVWDQEAQRFYRTRDTLTTVTYGDSGFAASDVLLVRNVESPKGDDITSKDDLNLLPLYGSTLPKGQTLGLVWEVYRAGGASGRARYHVSVELQNAAHRPVLTRLMRGIGIGRRAAATRIEYDSNRPMENGHAVEWLELGSDLQEGTYRLVFGITDQQTGTVVEREREIRVR